jgi:hypothetical protein
MAANFSRALLNARISVGQTKAEVSGVQTDAEEHERGSAGLAA